MLSKRTQLTIAILGFVFLAFAVLNPNPFGNNPDAVGDESQFLSGALSAIKKPTLPGWEFSPSANFYGGVQAYLDAAALVPVLAIVRLMAGDTNVAQLMVALNTGELIHVLRLVSGLVVLGVIAAALWMYFKNKWPTKFGYKLLLLLTLLFSNSLFVGIMHSAKVWALYIILEVILGTVVVAQEYSRQQEKLFLAKEKYVAVLFWLSLLIILQNAAGIVALVWVLYAVYFNHVTINDFFVYLKKKIWLVLLILATQLAFFYRGWRLFFGGEAFSLTSLSGSTVRDSAGAINWAVRLLDPIIIAVKSQPFIFVYLLLVCTTLFLIFKTKKWDKLILVALAHPILVYSIRHGILGIGGIPRHVLPLTVAFIFSLVMLLNWKTILGKITLTVSLILFVLVSAKSIYLYWQPSSEKRLNAYVTENLNSADNTFIIDGSAGTLSLPLNRASLEMLDESKKNMGRYQFLLQNVDAVDTMVDFRPTVLMGAAKPAGAQTWVISMGCAYQCQEKELQAGSCIPFNQPACSINALLPNEISTLDSFFKSKMLGYVYSLRKYEP